MKFSTAAAFRRIWVASLFSNFGQLIQSVGAAWAMTQLTGRADMVALVQTATFAPLMLISLPAGAIADSYDRRKIALFALGIAISGAAGLSRTPRARLTSTWWPMAGEWARGRRPHTPGPTNGSS